MREREAGADLRRELGAVVARSEQEDRRQRHVGRHRAHVAERMIIRKAVAARSAAIPGSARGNRRRRGCPAAGATRPTSPDRCRAPGRCRDRCVPGNNASSTLKRSATVERRVVRQHHAARSDPHARGHRRDLADHDVGRGACDIREVMVLGDPIARDSRDGRRAVPDRGCCAKPARRSRRPPPAKDREPKARSCHAPPCDGPPPLSVYAECVRARIETSGAQLQGSDGRLKNVKNGHVELRGCGRLCWRVCGHGDPRLFLTMRALATTRFGRRLS